MSVIQISAAGDHFRKKSVAVRAAAKKGLYSAALRGVQTLVVRIIPSRSPQPVDRGLYRAGWRADVEEYGASISNPEAHSIFVEEGVRGSNVKAGRRMITALREWVIRKGLAPKVVVPVSTSVRFNKATGKFTATKTNVHISATERATMAFVWAIVGAMKRRGIFNRSGSAGLGIARELAALYLPEYAAQEIEREVMKVLE